MANYCCAVRTNYFRVKDQEKFRNFMNSVVAAEDSVEVWETEDGRFGFGCYSSILGVSIDDGDDYDYFAFEHGLSELVADDDAILIMESGNEKLRYVTGGVLIITRNGTEYVDMITAAYEKAAEMLQNRDWETQVSY